MAAEAKNTNKHMNDTKLNETMVETPDMVQDYIASMLKELSDMARSSGLPHLSSLLQVSLLAVNTDSRPLD